MGPVKIQHSKLVLLVVNWIQFQSVVVHCKPKRKKTHKHFLYVPTQLYLAACMCLRNQKYYIIHTYFTLCQRASRSAGHRWL